MFLSNEAINAKVLSVFDLEWEAQNLSSGKRPYHAISFRSVGNSTFVTDDYSLDIRTGEIAFVPANLIYTHKSKHEKLFVAHFTADQPMPDKILTFKPQNPEYYEKKFRDLYVAWNKKQLGYEYECKVIFYKILLELEREWGRKNLENYDDKIYTAVEYIHEHFTDRGITVEGLARICSMSDTYFRRLFVSRFGITPLKYINDLRLARAKELLQSDYYTVEEVAEQCGFNNINYFSLFIKKETGYPPSAYRSILLDRAFQSEKEISVDSK